MTTTGDRTGHRPAERERATRMEDHPMYLIARARIDVLLLEAAIERLVAAEPRDEHNPGRVARFRRRIGHRLVAIGSSIEGAGTVDPTRAAADCEPA